MKRGDKEMNEEKTLIVDVNEKPRGIEWLFLSFQHVFAMFGATILVPMLTGFPVSVALFASGIGTLIYTICTKRKVPVYLGSSFAYITAVILAVEAMGGDISAAQTGLILVGVIYVVVAIIIKFVGKDWIDKLLPPIVIGPMIAVIGLGLASNAVNNAGFVENGKIAPMIIAIITFLVAALISSKAKGFLKIIPVKSVTISSSLFSVSPAIKEISTFARSLMERARASVDVSTCVTGLAFRIVRLVKISAFLSSFPSSSRYSREANKQ